MENTRRSFIRNSALGVAGLTLAGTGMSAKSYGSITGKENNVQLMYL